MNKCLKNSMAKMGAITTSVLFLFPKFAYADIQTYSVNTVASKAQGVVSTIVEGFGGVLIFASIALLAVKLIMAHNNPDKRTSVIGGLGWLIGGAALLGAALMTAGFFWGLGK